MTKMLGRSAKVKTIEQHGTIFRMNANSEDINLKIFDEEFQIDLVNLLRERTLGSYEKVLKEMFARNGNQYENIVKYAMSKLPADDKRPNKELAALFLVLSHIKTLNFEWRSLLTDLMVFCETTESDGLSMHREKLLIQFNKMEL